MTDTQRNRPTPNRLASEKSPYLLQHRFNPVDWFPWTPEAHAKAQGENKPLFVSIGYSTCHWCHVMERESFEDAETADFLNRQFISVKVDREERPDVDKIYMTAVQAMTGQGGWPLNVFLAPNLKPFYGGTYWPPAAKYGRPSFLQVLQHIHNAWIQNRDEVEHSANELHHRLTELGRRQIPDNPNHPGVIQNAGTQLKQGFDPVNGGFGRAPKFPTPSHPSFLLRYGTRFQDQEAVHMVLHTCERMAAGGIYDQLGGGFSRYSVDPVWLVPHFEKMLYDNAQLLHLYLDAFLVTGQDRFGAVARDLIRYVLRDMTHPLGGFYSAEDADSEGKEGKFYCWTRQDFSRILTPEEFNVAVDYFGVTEQGNFVDHSDPDPLLNQNVLSVARPDQRAEDLPLLESAKAKLLEARSHRVRPHLDDKILASWNGLFLGALSRAAVIFQEPAWFAAASKNLGCLRNLLWNPDTRTLYHRWRDGQRDSVQLLEGYAFLLDGVIELYQATLREEHLHFALELAQTMIERFYDPAEGGFWQSPRASEDLILRVKDDYDGAEPSGNSVAILALLKLSAITARPDLREPAEKSLQYFSDRLQRIPQAVAYMLAGLDFSLDEPTRVVIVGDPDAPDTKALLRATHSIYRPNRVVLGNAGSVDPFASELGGNAKTPTAFVCSGTACHAPTSSPEELRELLSGS